MSKEKIDYDLVIYAENEYEIDTVIPIKGKLFTKMLAKAKKNLAKKTGSDLDINTEYIDGFDIDEKFFSLLRTAAGHAIKDIMKEMQHDNKVKTIRFTKHYEILNCKMFKKDQDNWQAKMKISGRYITR